MDLSMRWLKEFVELDPEPRAFSHAMTMSGSKVEGYTVEGAGIERIVVGKVLEVTPHPDSDHLVVCRIDAGQEKELQIVTGAQNVTAGSLVPVALDGSVLPDGKKIKTGKLRGVVSEGMLCSLGELGLTAHDFPYAIEDGIFLIEEDCRVGQDIREAIGLNDTIVEFEITPNRPDCLSVIGLAREAAATRRKPLKLHTPQVKGCGDAIENYVSVEVQNPELCPRYTCKVIKNVRVAPSPRWLRERLRASGVRPINNLVDITNYVMLEYGQPLHAFDARFVDGKKIIVRNARPGEAMQTLDGVDRQLNEGMLVISDVNKAIAVAGVMGGENSAIVDDTNTVILESANFLGRSVRTTSRELGLRTDASSRYEKGLDPQNTMGAVLRACELVELLNAGDVVDGVVDVNNAPAPPAPIRLDVDWINRFLGISLSRQEMEDILVPLGLTVEGEMVLPPSYRADLENKADLAEEIARFYGYDKIPSALMRGTAEALPTPFQRFERSAHTILQACGCYEVSTYSFISPRYYDKINLPADSPLRQGVRIMNPLGEDTSVMRTTILPSMLEVLSRNYNRKNEAFWAYEVANEYIPTAPGQLPEENPQITLGLYGNGCGFYTLKGILERLLQGLHVTGWDIGPVSDNPVFHPGRCAELTLGDRKLGILGEVHPGVLENYGLGVRAYLAKLDMKTLFALRETRIEYKPMPKYPAASRDLSLICDRDLPILTVEKTIRSAAGARLESVKLFDVYQGEQIDSDKKSVSYTLVMRSPDSTLTDEEADSTVKRVLKALEKINVLLREK